MMRPHFAGPILTLLVTLRAACAAPADLSVMTFNVWSGENSAAGRDKLAEILQAADADIVGLQEMGNSAGEEIAAALGYHYHQQSGGDIQVLSRYPIVGTSPGNLGVRIEVDEYQHVWLFNAHLAAYPYQPYDLRDGNLPLNEAAVIAAADAARGGQVTNYLIDMVSALGSGETIFFTGDFNEPSHLDWTQAAADATPRASDLKVAYPTSTRITDAGFTDSLRSVRPDEVNDTAYTWTPGAPPPNLSPFEVHDRIDIVYHRGAKWTPFNAFTIGLDNLNPNTDLAIPGYNADHRAVVVEYLFGDPPEVLPGDVNLDGALNDLDVAAFTVGWLSDTVELPLIDRYAAGDLNFSGRTDLADWGLLRAAVMGAGLPAPTLIVPEPTALATLLMSGLPLLLGRRSILSHA
jgi:endonuclease/exonuclease/phosphatase family metal-dependent hydrolase